MCRSFSGKLALAIAASLTLSCSNQTAPLPPKTQVDQPPNLSAGVTKLASSSEAFGLLLFKQCTRERPEGNLVVSPLSVAMALAMTYNGSAGATREAMQQTLLLSGMTDEEVNESFADLIGLLTHMDEDVTTSIANSIWFRTDFPIEQSFLATNQEVFDARIDDLDFSQDQAADIINAWVAEQTHEKIKTIVEAPLDPQLVMMLVNAVYFKGLWTYPFDSSATTDGTFTTPAGGTVAVPMMALDAGLDYSSTSHYEAVDLPYGAGDFAMTLILPAINFTVDDIIASFTEDTWTELLAGLHQAPGHVFLPRFKVTCDLSLNDVLSALGMAVVFQPDDADFSGISRTDKLSISEVRHKAYVAVDEQGTEAAAVTGIGVRVTSINPDEFTIRFDRPFLFAIRERNSGSLMFLGRVTDPTAEQ